MRSFRNPQTNVLTSFGYAESNNDDLSREEGDSFDATMEPGKWQLVADQWVAYTPIVSALGQLLLLDKANTLTERNLRETIMLMAEAFKQLSNGQMDLTKIPGIHKVYAVEAEAAVLRAKL